MTNYKNWDSDQRIQLHLELHALDILEDLFESDRLPPLEGFEQVKFDKLALHCPPPPKKPDYSKVKMVSKLLGTGVTYEVPAPGEHEKYVKEWQRWMIPPMLRKLKSTIREIKEIEEKLSGSYNELLFEKLRYKRRLKELIEQLDCTP